MYDGDFCFREAIYIKLQTPKTAVGLFRECS